MVCVAARSSGKGHIAVITGKHTFIRGAEYDDVPALAGLYQPGIPRAGLLDARREPVMPSVDDLRELLGRKEIAEGAFYTVEDTDGRIRGFSTLRGMNPEARHCEFSLLFLEPESYGEPLADEVAAVMLERSFQRFGLRKVVSYCLAHERDFANLLVRHGFVSAGRQRDVLYAGGRWHDLDTYVRTSKLSVVQTDAL